MKIVFYFFCIIICFNTVYGQKAEEKTIAQIEDSLVILSDYIKNEALFTDRYRSNREFIPLLVTALKKKNSFQYQFDKLDFISVLYAPDSTFRVITWLIRPDDKQGNKYFGAIQMNNSERLELYALQHQKEAIENFEGINLETDNWYGCIYYNIIMNEFKGKKSYTVFGWDGGGTYTTKKYIDVININEGKPTFGDAVFDIKKDGKRRLLHRVKFEYNEKAAVTVNYDVDLKQIVFDHIAPEDGESFGMYPTYIPDGTYEALKFDNGKWNYIEKVFHLTFDTPPMPAPLFKNKGPAPFAMPKN